MLGILWPVMAYAPITEEFSMSRANEAMAHLEAGKAPVSYRIKERSMKYYLAKSEPSVYSIEDLERDQKTVWGWA